MTRRMQLLEPERRSSTTLRLAALVDRIRAGLPRDNRIIPGVLAGLALLVFAWLVAGALLGEPGVQEEQQASNQASLAQEDPDSGEPETPAPGVENRDTDSYAEFGAPRDPFRNLLQEDGGDRNGGDGGDRGGSGGDRGGNGGNGDRGGNGGNGDRGGNDGNGGDRGGNGGNGGNGGDRSGNGGNNGDRGGGGSGNGDRGGNGDRDGGGDSGDFIEQEPAPGAPGAPGSIPGSTLGDGPGGAPGGGPGQGGGGLFNSGGDLPIP